MFARNSEYKKGYIFTQVYDNFGQSTMIWRTNRQPLNILRNRLLNTLCKLNLRDTICEILKLFLQYAYFAGIVAYLLPNNYVQEISFYHIISINKSSMNYY